jgi:hypothetical protein
MKRISLFLREDQIKKAKSLCEKIEGLPPMASLVRRALDHYFKTLKQGGITPELSDGRVARSRLNSSLARTKKKSAQPKMSAQDNLNALRKSVGLKTLPRS